MQFGILGPLEVTSADGASVAVGGPRPRALLVMLLLNAGRMATVEELIDGQYGDDPPAGAANAIQAQVSRLRRAVGTDLIEFHGRGYRLAVRPEDVDAHRFQRLCGEGRGLLAAGNPAGAAAVLRTALALWRGPALSDLPHGTAQAARLQDLRLAASEDLVEAELSLPDGTSVGSLRQLVVENPLRERLRGQLMRALQVAGRPAEALQEFDAARRLLSEELGADPSPELAAVHLAILRAEQPAPIPIRGLPAQLTSFLGRDRELEQLASQTARLVTVVGPGGTGKTRLAIEAAGRRPIEACFADLSPLDAGDQLPLAVLSALGRREGGFAPGAADDPVRRLVAALADQDLLLVLDNCEHLITAAADLARALLGECPALHILATSREPLGLTGESLVPLAPLELPSKDAEDSAAVRLFADRAAAVRPGFTIGPDNIAAISEICIALDGLPLAIELAAARLRQFTVAEIGDRLVEHGPFRLLSRGDRTAATRHRTLHAVVAWSWELLGPDEQALARRFAVFTGGAPLPAVEAICGLADADELLADLVDKSLIESDGTRYRMFDTIRYFCAERLLESGEEESFRRAHAGYHRDFAQRADPHLRRSEQLDWLARLAAEHDNLMAALRWAVRADRETAFRMIAALAAYWWLSGRRVQAGAAAAELIAGGAPEGMEEEYVSCVAHAVPRPGPEHWERAGAMMRSMRPAMRHPFGAAVWGMAAGPWGPSPESELQLGSDPWNVALGRLSRGLLWVQGGQTDAGERELLGVLADFRALGERWGTAQALDWLAQVAGWRGEWERAQALWAQALEQLEELGALEECVDVLCRRADCLLRQGDPVLAETDYRRAVELSSAAGRAAVPPAAALGLGEIARWRGDLAEAGELLDRAQESARVGDFGIQATRARIRTARARLAAEAGDPAVARQRHREALADVRTSPLSADLADAAEGQADAALLAGSAGRAALLLGVAVALRGTAVTGDANVGRTAAAARSELGAAFATAYSRGAAMGRDEALTILDGAPS